MKIDYRFDSEVDLAWFIERETWKDEVVGKYKDKIVRVEPTKKMYILEEVTETQEVFDNYKGGRLKPKQILEF